MSRQIELVRDAVINLLACSDSKDVFQRQVEISEAVYLQLITKTGFVTFRTTCKKADPRVTKLPAPNLWKGVSAGRVVPTKPELEVEVPAHQMSVVCKVGDEEARRVSMILLGDSPIAPITTLSDSVVAVLVKESQVCLWLSKVPGESVHHAAWTRNMEDVPGIYAVFNPGVRKVVYSMTEADALSVGLLNKHPVLSVRDSKHAIVTTVIAAHPEKCPHEITYQDRGSLFRVSLNSNGCYEILENKKEEEVRTKLTDPSVLLQGAAAGVPSAVPEEESKPAQPAEPAVADESSVTVDVSDVSASIEVAEELDVRTFDTAEDVHLTEAADGTIVTETYAEVEQPETVQETAPEQEASQGVSAGQEAEPTVEQMLDDLEVSFSDFKTYAAGVAKGIKTVKRLYKAESRELLKAAKSGAELDKLKADNAQLRAELAKLKAENARLKSEADKAAPLLAALKSLANSAQ